VASNHSVLPSGHGSVVPCHGSVLLSLFWGGVKFQLCLCLVTLGYVTIGCVQMPPDIQLSAQDVIFSAWTFKSAFQSCLRITLDSLVTG
jgi:hypothetical protein